MNNDLSGLTAAVLVGQQTDTLVTTRVKDVQVTVEGFTGDKHAGLTHPADSRTPFYPRGTQIFNDRQVSVVSAEELAGLAARLELPHPGVWRWGVASGLAVLVQWMPDLNVPAAVARAESAAPNVPALWVAAAGALLALGSLLLQHRIRRALPLAFIASGICIAGFAAAFYPLVVPSKTLAFAPLPAVEVKEAGEALFMAKGCVVCHTHVRVSLPANQMMHIDMGAPDLTNYRLGEEYLRLWLSDPAAVKPETDMPNLELSPAEIDALVTFLMVEP